MKIPTWIKSRIQRDTSKPISSREILGLILGIIYLAALGLIAFRYIEAWLTPTSQEKALHKKCVVIATEFAKGAESAYKDAYALCRRGDL